MRIYNNIMAINAYRNVSLRYNALMRSMERLSSGLRINRAADDPAGLAISERMRAQIRGLKQASRNAQDAISMLQVAEGALNQTSAILQRIRELTVQAATGTNSESDLEAIQLEIEQLLDELNRIAGDTNFNTIPLLNSQSESKQPSSATFRIQIGANSGQYMEISLANMGAAALGIAEIDVTKDADGALSLVEQAIKMAASERGKIGAYQNRLEHTINNLEQTALNLQAAESRIRDADLAEEMMEYTKNLILLQAAVAMLAQANAVPQMVLQLLW
ncbi:MAG: flagellin [Firmicutes bacterium]|jgi:flagellin|nr:flagellin [Bacillota bacterium]